MFDGHPGLYEYERKFLLEADRARAFWDTAAARLPSTDGVRPCHVRTTYFDTADLAYHRSSTRGVRRRVRVREYARSDATGADFSPAERCYLELKQSSDGVRHKLRVAIAPDEIDGHLARIAGAPMIAWVATLYRRRALTDASGRLRVTLDDHLVLCRPLPIGSPLALLQPGDVLAQGPPFVLELKFSDPPPAWLCDALADLREAVGFSKFNLGMRAIERASEQDLVQASC
jgi:hypothetical protein